MAKTEMIKTWAIRAFALSLLGLSVWSYIAIQTDWLEPKAPAKPSPPRNYVVECDWVLPRGRIMLIVVDPKYRLYENEKKLKERLLSDLSEDRNFFVTVFDNHDVARGIHHRLNDIRDPLKDSDFDAHCIGFVTRNDKEGIRWRYSIETGWISDWIRPF